MTRNLREVIAALPAKRRAKIAAAIIIRGKSLLR